MVSPPYKADYGVANNATALGAAPNGESYVFSSLGAFSGARADFVSVPYVARRTSEGWVTSATNPPPADGRFPGYTVDYTPDLSRQIAPVSAQKGGIVSSAGTAALILSDLLSPEIPFIQAWPLPDGPATFPTEPGDSSSYSGASADLSHVIFTAGFGGLYQIVGIGGSEPKEEAVAVVGEPDGSEGTILQPCPGGSRGKIVELDGRLHAISNDGAEVFFRHCENSYVRVDGSSTFELSSGGDFWGAAQDGSKAFVTNKSGELSMDLIDSEPGSEAIVETASLSPGAPASVIVSSDDGSHVYFTSPAVLAGANLQGSFPESGASNLYVYDSVTRQTSFIAVSEVDESKGAYQAQTTPDGRFLVFTTNARLTSEDTDIAADVYRYDAESGELVRVSLGEGGHDENGNSDAYGASIAPSLLGGEEDRAIPTWRLDTRAISDDGTYVVFSTAEPLSARAVNGNTNIYAWHEGRVSMISTGHSQTSDEFPVVSQSGRDVFFLTSQSILPQDTDGLTDVYDARIGGGFPEPNVPIGGCSGDTCQGPPSVPSLLSPPASATFSGLGNPLAPVSNPAVESKGKLKTNTRSKCWSGYKRAKHGKCTKIRRIARKARSGALSRGARP